MRMRRLSPKLKLRKVTTVTRIEWYTVYIPLYSSYGGERAARIYSASPDIYSSKGPRAVPAPADTYCAVGDECVILASLAWGI
jgi:hypothetical protein